LRPAGPPRTVHVLHNSEQPAAVFALLESPGPPPKTVPLVADGIFDLLMIKMGSIYANKKQTRMEARGARFEFADFLVKIGTVTMSQNFKGVLVEVSFFQSKISILGFRYLDAGAIDVCWGRSRSGGDILMGRIVRLLDAFFFRFGLRLIANYIRESIRRSGFV
jgi:hypothetical protein